MRSRDISRAVILAALLAGCSTRSRPTPATIPSPAATPDPAATPLSTSQVGDDDPTGQPGHPRLGGTQWVLTELDGAPLEFWRWLSFWGGAGTGRAEGTSESNCSFIFFSYSYAADGSGIAFRVSSQSDGSYTEGCSAAEVAQYVRTVDALQRVTAWRMPEPDRLELLDADGALLLAGEPPPPLPSPPPGGDCGSVPVDRCIEAATIAFVGLPISSGQAVAGWTVRPTIYVACPASVPPLYDVVIELANPAYEKIVAVYEASNGRLVPCGDY
jgi:hypothetical protein